MALDNFVFSQHNFKAPLGCFFYSMAMKKIFPVFFLSLLFIACQKEASEGSRTDKEQTLLNVSYVYLPANRTTAETKVLVLVHGGAWSTGDKTEFNEYIPVLKERLPGYAFININYRLAQLPSTHLFPTQETDVKAAFSAIVAKAAEYRFNKEKLAVLGASAGAHLALLQSYKNSTPRVKAVVDMFGPTDMVALYNSLATPIERFALQSLLGGTPSSNPAMYQASSPIHFVSSQSPPTLILHGGADPLVPVSQSHTLKAKLESFSVPVQMVVYPTEGHGWFGANLTDSYVKISAFLTTYNP
jgi:acetyl esterase/lipase